MTVELNEVVKDLEMKVEKFKREKTERENRLRYEVKELARWMEDMIADGQTEGIKKTTDKINDLVNDINLHTLLISNHEQLLKAVK